MSKRFRFDDGIDVVAQAHRHLAEMRRRLDEFNAAPADERVYTSYASQGLLISDLTWVIEQLEAAQKFMLEHVAPLRSEAMDVSERYEPCGYYCDEGHEHCIDHKLYIQAKFLFGGGTEESRRCPAVLEPKA